MKTLDLVNQPSVTTGVLRRCLEHHSKVNCDLHGLTSLYLFFKRFSGFLASPTACLSDIDFNDDSFRIFYNVQRKFYITFYEKLKICWQKGNTVDPAE